ncbi:uncharacterized protein LOC119668850 [Teleopsis dalmanni]|uniref:uncharacterized protein LOC119668850 n=1 Tax=Teleopsis dalmanni TaxID=139649 RepID=UPI0018CEC3B5|nr:uncharacterized protein LOC119668850 [Teleopsis dalmanni]
MSQRVELVHDKIPILCRSVRKFPVVYDRGHKDYHNRALYEEAWAAIAIECEDTVNICKNRWKSIRDSCRRSIRNDRSPKKRTSTRMKDNYVADLAEFLVPHLQMNDENDDMERFGNEDPTNKEKDAKKTKFNSAKTIDPSTIGKEPSFTNEDHSHDTYMISKKSTKESSTLVLKKTSDIKKILDIDKNDDDMENEKSNDANKDKDNDIDGNIDIDDDIPRSSYRRSCKKNLDKNDTKKSKVTPKTVTKRSYRKINPNTKTNVDLQVSDTENEEIPPAKFAKVQTEIIAEKQTGNESPSVPPAAKKILVVNTNTTIKPVMCEKSVQFDTNRSVEDKYFDIFKPYIKTMNKRQLIVLTENIFKAIVTTLDDCRDFNGASTPVANEVSKRLFKESLGNREMYLVNEMVNLILAAKHTPDSVIASPPSKKDEEKTVENKSDSVPKIVVRKPIELRSNGSVYSFATPTGPGARPGSGVPCRVLEKVDGDKRRIYRIIPKTNIVNNAPVTGNALSVVSSPTNSSNPMTLHASNTTVTTTANITAPTFTTSSITSPYSSITILGTSSMGTATTATASVASSSNSVPTSQSGQQTANIRTVNWAAPSSVVTTSSGASNLVNRNIISRAQVSAVPAVKFANRRFSICDPSVLNRTSTAGISGTLSPFITALPKNNATQRIIAAQSIQLANGQRVRPITLYDNQNGVFIPTAPTATTFSPMKSNTPTTVSTANAVPSLTPIQKTTVPIVMAPLRISPNVAVKNVSTANNARAINNLSASLLRQNAPITAPKVVQKPVQKPTKVIRKRASKPQPPPDNSDSQDETAGIIATDELGPWIKNEPLDELNF